MTGLGEILRTCAGLTEPAALATLVRVKGSSYRQPGARMLFRPSGAQTGLISAGCLETDVKARVETVLASRAPQLACFDAGSELDLIWGTGMGCAGRVEVLLEPLTGPLPAWMEACARILRERRTGVLATVFATRGSTPFQTGDRFLQSAGEPGLLPPPGPAREALLAAMDRVRERPGNETWTDPDGSMDLLFEPIRAPLALWLFGAGEHAMPLARLAKGMGWWLGLVDHRPALATAERFPEADRIVIGHPPEVFQGLPLDRRSAALVVSHVYDQDRSALAALLDQPLGYLGLQGNRARSARILRELEAEGRVLDLDQRQRLHWPAGLDLGGESPEAIALAMIAEIQAVLAGHSGGSLRDQPGSIHPRPPAP
jgi:xanthine/CO dehydrogenase XdhC/CoxF family maturation factor